MQNVAYQPSAARVLVRREAGDERLGVLEGGQVGKPGPSAEDRTCHTETRIPVSEPKPPLCGQSGNEIGGSEMILLCAVRAIDCQDASGTLSILG